MTQEHPVRRGQRYNRLVLIVFAVAIAAYLVGMAIGQSFLGLLVYAAGGLGGVGALLYLRFVSSVRLVDERQRRLHDRTSGTVADLLAYVGLPAVIGLYLLDATGVYDIGPTLWGAIFAFSAFGLLWGGIYLYYRFGP